MTGIMARVRESPWLWRGLQAGAAVLVIALLAAGGWTWSQWRESRGNVALAEALALAQRAQGPQAGPEARDRAIKALESVVTQFPRLAAFPQAATELGSLRYGAGQYAASRAAYKLAAAKGQPNTVTVMARVGIGYTWEAERDFANASKAYEAVLKGLGPKDFLYEEILLSLGRSQDLAGYPAAAIETYQRLLKDVPDSRRADEVRVAIAGLKSRPKS